MERIRCQAVVCLEAGSLEITTGNIGQNARNLIALRNNWQNILDETDSFLREHIPFEIIYDPRLKQEGGINYSSGTIDLGFAIMTKPTEGFNIIYDVLKGLKRTGRQEEWGFRFWPFGLHDYYNEEIWRSWERKYPFFYFPPADTASER